MKKGAMIVFVAACALFLLSRFLIVTTSIDHLGHVSAEEIHVTTLAKNILKGETAAHPFTHLWGKGPTAYSFIPFLKTASNEMAALKTMAILLGFIHFAIIVFLFAWRGGPLAAGIISAFLLFPDIKFLKWSMTIWGGYPEAVLLSSIPILLVAIGESRRLGYAYILAGIFAGLVSTYSATLPFLPFAIAAAIILPNPLNRPGRVLLLFAAGFAMGAAPFGIWALSSPEHTVFEPYAFIKNSEAIPWADAVWLPRISSLSELVSNINLDGYFSNRWFYTFGLLSIIWFAVFRTFKKGIEKTEAWQRTYFYSFAMAAVALSMFSFGYFLKLRHLLWFYPATYICMTVMLSSDISFGKSDKLRARIKWGWRILAVLITVNLVSSNFTQIAWMIQPAEYGILARHRGPEYELRGIFEVVGKEVENINSVLDAMPDKMNEPAFFNGFGKGFSGRHKWDSLVTEPYVPNYSNNFLAVADDVDLSESSDRREFFTGFGCALAAKPTLGSEQFDIIRQRYNYSDLEAAQNGHAHCADILKQ